MTVTYFLDLGKSLARTRLRKTRLSQSAYFSFCWFCWFWGGGGGVDWVIECCNTCHWEWQSISLIMRSMGREVQDPLIDWMEERRRTKDSGHLNQLIVEQYGWSHFFQERCKYFHCRCSMSKAPCGGQGNKCVLPLRFFVYKPSSWSSHACNLPIGRFNSSQLWI